MSGLLGIVPMIELNLLLRALVFISHTMLPISS